MSRLDRYKELIEQGDIKGAIKRIKRWDQEAAIMGSEFTKMIFLIHAIDESMRQIVLELESGDSKQALSKIDWIKKNHLRSIHKHMREMIRHEIDFDK
jgi:hypothetical protein